MSAAEPATADFVGDLNFQTNKVKRSLAADGNIYAIVDSTTGGFSAFVGTDLQPIPTAIHNGRLAGSGQLTLDTAGFELIPHTLPANVDFYDEPQVLTAYYDEVCRVVQAATGAYKVYAFDHVVRQTGVSMNYAVKDGVKVGGPATMVHGDYAALGAPIRRDNFARPPKKDDTFVKTHGSRPLIAPDELDNLKGRRFAIVNLWRSIDSHPVVDMPLTMCDCRTVTADDYVAIQFRYSDDTSHETYLGGHSPAQRWYYFPEMSCDEAILLKTYDSQGIFWRDQPNYAPYHSNEPTVNVSSTLHSAVRDPRLDGEEYAKRQSIEVRTIVFY